MLYLEERKSRGGIEVKKSFVRSEGGIACATSSSPLLRTTVSRGDRIPHPSTSRPPNLNSMPYMPYKTLQDPKNRKSTAYLEPFIQPAQENLGNEQTRNDGHQRSRHRVQGVERDLPSRERLATRVGRCCPLQPCSYLARPLDGTDILPSTRFKLVMFPSCS